MFVLAQITDKIKTSPKDFNRDPTEVLIEQIEAKYSNKILQDVGLGICFFDFCEVKSGLIYPGEGSAHCVCTFNFVFFRPFVGEVLDGVIEDSDETGLRISVSFFDDIWIPRENLPGDCIFDEVTREYHTTRLHSETGSDENDEMEVEGDKADQLFKRNSRGREKEKEMNSTSSSGNRVVRQTRSRSNSLSHEMGSTNGTSNRTATASSSSLLAKSELSKSGPPPSSNPDMVFGFRFLRKRKVRFRVRELEFNLSKDTAKGLQTWTSKDDLNKNALAVVMARQGQPLVKIEVNSRDPIAPRPVVGAAVMKLEIPSSAEEMLPDPPSIRRRSSSITKETIQVSGLVGEAPRMVYRRPPCLRIIGSLDGTGLGMPDWWQ